MTDGSYRNDRGSGNDVLLFSSAESVSSLSSLISWIQLKQVNTAAFGSMLYSDCRSFLSSSVMGAESLVV